MMHKYTIFQILTRCGYRFVHQFNGCIFPFTVSVQNPHKA